MEKQKTEIEKGMEQKAKNIKTAQDRQHKFITEHTAKKEAQIKSSVLLNNAVLLITKYPDNWKEKLEDVLECGKLLEAMLDTGFATTFETLKTLRGGIIGTHSVEELQKQNLNQPNEPF